MTRKAPEIVHYLITLALGLILSGCGGNSGKSNTPEPPPPPPPPPVVERLEISPFPLSLAKGTTIQPEVTAIYTDNRKDDVTDLVTWQVATDGLLGPVDGTEGIFRGLSAGETLLRATMADAEAQVAVTIRPAELRAIEVSPPLIEMAKGLRQELTVTGLYTDDSHQTLLRDVQWQVSGDGIAMDISATKSELKALDLVAGATVTATVGQHSFSVPVTVTAPMLVQLQASPARISLPSGFDVQPRVDGIFSDGSRQDLSEHVSWASTDSNVAEVDEFGVVYLHQEGNTRLTASVDQLGLQVDVNVLPAQLQELHLSPEQTSLAAGRQIQLKATGVYSDDSLVDVSDKVIWQSGDEQVLRVDNGRSSAGKAHALKTGQVDVNASLDKVSAQTRVVVTAAVLDEIALEPPSIRLPAGRQQSVQAWGLYSDGSKQELTEQVSWLVADASVAHVSHAVGKAGLLTGLIEQTTQVTATLDGVAGSAPVEVSAAVLSFVQISPPLDSLAKGQSAQLRAVAVFSDDSRLDVTDQAIWYSTNTNFLRFSNDPPGRLLAVEENSAAVNIGAVYQNKEINHAITVSQAVLEHLHLTSTLPVLPKGAQARVTATGVFSDGSELDLSEQVLWRSGDNQILTLDDTNRLILAQNPGQADVVASVGAISGRLPITVSAQSVAAIEVSPGSGVFHPGQRLSLDAVAILSDNSLVQIAESAQWRSDNPAVASIDQQGGMSVHTSGTVTIEARFGTISGSATFTITDATLVRLELSPQTLNLPINGELTFSATALYDDGASYDLSQAVSWFSDKPALAHVDNQRQRAGRVRALNAGVAMVSARYQGVSASTSVTVEDAVLSGLEINAASTQLVPGVESAIGVSGLYENNNNFDLSSLVNWRSDDAGIAAIVTRDGQTYLRANSAGSTHVYAAFAGFEASLEVTVADATLQSLEISPPVSQIPLGLKQAFSAVGFYSNGSQWDLTSQVIWQSQDRTILSIENGSGLHGLASTLKLGSVVISAQFGEAQAELAVVVSDALLTAIQLEQPYVKLAVGTSFRPRAKGIYSDGSQRDISTQVSWNSSQGEVAYVDADLRLNALSGGNTTLTAVLDGVSASAYVDVTAADLAKLEIRGPVNLPVGIIGRLELWATFTDGHEQSISQDALWQAGDLSLVVLDSRRERGKIIGLRKGVVNIKASFLDQATTLSLTVTDASLKSISINNKTTVSIANGLSYAMTATATYSDGSQLDVTSQALWTSSNAAIAGISNGNGGSGVLTTHDLGEVVIGIDWQGTTDTHTLSVVDDPTYPGGMVMGSLPSAILADGADMAQIVIDVIAADPSVFVSDGTLVNLAIVHGSGVLSSAQEATVDGRVSVNLTTDVAGPVVVRASVDGQNLSVSTVVIAVDQIQEILSKGAFSSVLIDNDLLQPGSQFGLHLTNNSNRELTVLHLVLTNNDAEVEALLNIDIPLRNGASIGNVVVTQGEPLPLGTVRLYYRVKDVASGEEFDIGAEFDVLRAANGAP